MDRKGFTLIELLVVIAIIAIIAAILFPVFSAAREKAREATCSSNLKQIGLATMQYMGDFDETYPPCATAVRNSNNQWEVLLFPYTKSSWVYIDPNNPSPGLQVISAGISIPNGHNYGVNTNLIVSDGNSNVATICMSQVHSPSNIAMFMDSLQLGDAGGWDFNQVIMASFNSAASTGSYAPLNPDWARHQTGSNICFGDGHVKFYSEAQLAQTIPTSTSASFNPNQTTNCTSGSDEAYCWGVAMELDDRRVN